MKELRTAIIGLNESGRHLLDAVAGVEYYHIEAVADKDTKLAEELAVEFNCLAFDDYRQLVIQNQLDCVLVAEGLHCCDEYVKAAMKKKFHILKLPPCGRDFEEALEFVRLAKEAEIQFAIANTYSFAQSFLELEDFLCQAESPSLLNGFCQVDKGSCSGWHSDKKLAGGGVLLHNSYQLLGCIINNFGLPQEVYSVTSSLAVDRKQRLYLTEDNAVVAMKFNDSLIGNINAVRHPGREDRKQILEVYTANSIITVTDTEFVVRDADGVIKHSKSYDDSETERMKKVLENFALSILSPEEHNLRSSGSDNLKNMAVIEAAYLSARTSMPEEPQRILQIEQGDMTNIWPTH